MKYLRYYEEEKEHQIGDYVTCVEPFGSIDILEKDKVYQIEKIKKEEFQMTQYKLVGTSMFWDCSRFRSSTKKEIAKYHITKYNI